jgi:uncharacterized membrane protein
VALPPGRADDQPGRGTPPGGDGVSAAPLARGEADGLPARPGARGHPPMPAWRRETPGEQRWPSAVAILVMIGLQLVLPEWLTLGPRWLFPAFEGLMIAVLVLADPGHMRRDTPALRMLALTLIAVASLGNGVSVVRLVLDIAGGRDLSAAALLGSGAAVWTINVLTFAVWYWELDRGGPLTRALGTRPYPDFLFPQMTTPSMAHPEWEPRFYDYLYVAVTNSTAFSPTDTLPLSRRAKLTMALQSLISLVTAALVVARAVNTLR